MGRGGCCNGEEEDEVDYDPANKGPNVKRSCTDVLCLLLLVIFCFIWFGVAIYAFSRGNPFQLIYPSNSEGEICGRADYVDEPNLLFFDLTRCIKISAAVAGCATPQVCVKQCPDTYWTYSMGKKEGLESFCTDLSSGEYVATSMRDLVKKRKCPAYIIPSKPFLGRCVPTFGLLRATNETVKEVQKMETSTGEKVDSDDLRQGIEYLMKAIDLQGRGKRFLADLAGAWWLLLIGFVFAMLISFGWIMLLRLASKPVIWISIILCLAFLISATVFSWIKYVELMNDGDDAVEDDIFLPPVVSSLSSYYYNKYTWFVLGIVLGVITLVIILVLLFLFKRIQIAIELIEEASKAVGEMPSILFFPIVPFFAQFLVLLWFLSVGMFLATSGGKEYKVVDMSPTDTTCVNPETKVLYQNNEMCDPSMFNSACGNCTRDDCPQCVFHKFGPSVIDTWFQVYNFFGLFWLLFFFSAMGEMVLAGSFSGWYWTLDKDGPMENVGVMSSFYRTCRFHLGTLAFGSLILSFVRMIRVLLEWIEEKIKEHGAENPLMKCILCCCKCCFWCLEKFIRFINRNAYIMTAIYGYNFCTGARKSFMLITKNAARAFVLDKVADFVLFIGKVLIVAIVSAITFFLFSNQVTSALDIHLNYHFVPMIIIVLGTYAISSTFFSVYNMAVDTIFLCFLQDLEKHDGSPENPYFMNQDLMRILEIKEENKAEDL